MLRYTLRLAPAACPRTLLAMPDDSAPGHFPSTEWTMVLAAGSDATRARPALEMLCRSYWQPLYAFARRKGLTPEHSEDAVQGFMESILARRSLANVERDGGRFRSWLLAGFVHHLAIGTGLPARALQSEVMCLRQCVCQTSFADLRHEAGMDIT